MPIQKKVGDEFYVSVNLTLGENIPFKAVGFDIVFPDCLQVLEQDAPAEKGVMWEGSSVDFLSSYLPLGGVVRVSAVRQSEQAGLGEVCRVKVRAVAVALTPKAVYIHPTSFKVFKNDEEMHLSEKGEDAFVTVIENAIPPDPSLPVFSWSVVITE